MTYFFSIPESPSAHFNLCEGPHHVGGPVERSFRFRKPSSFQNVFLAALAIGTFGGHSAQCAKASPAATEAVATPTVASASLLDQIVAELHGESIATAKASDLVKAIRKVVARNPKEAAAVLADVLAVERTDMVQLTGQLVGAAIEGLGNNVTAVAVEDFVRLAIDLQPQSTLSVVASSIQAVSDCELVSVIVDTASEKRVASDNKNVVPLDGKEIVPVMAVSNSKEIIPADGTKIAPINTDISAQIAQLAFNTRPDCFANRLAPTLVTHQGNPDSFTVLSPNFPVLRPAVLSPALLVVKSPVVPSQ